MKIGTRLQSTAFRLALAGFATMGFAASASATPTAVSPGIAVMSNQANTTTVYVSITGRNFGTGSCTNSSVVLTRAGGAQQTVTVGSAITWKDHQVVVPVPRTFFNGSAISATVNLGIQTFFGCAPPAPTSMSQSVPVDQYLYSYYDTAPGDPYNSPPLHLTADTAGRVWVVSEFHIQLKYFNPATNGMVNLLVPTPALESQGPFWSFFTHAPTNNSQGGEAVALDPAGRVWFHQSGATPPPGAGNHSRIVMYSPATSSFSVYNVPGNDEEPIGLAIDPGYNSATDDDRVWFTAGARQETVTLPGGGSATVQLAGPRLISFLPFYQTSNGTFDYQAAAAALTCNRPDIAAVGTCSNVPTRNCLNAHDCVMADRFCPADVVYDYWCYHEFPITQATYPIETPILIGHLAVHPNDVSGFLKPHTVWFADYWGDGSLTHLGRFDPTYGAVRTDIFPLTTSHVPFIFPTGPWDVRILPSNDLVAASYPEAIISRFRFSDRLDPKCKNVDRPISEDRSASPCLDAVFIPGAQGRCVAATGTCSNAPARTCTADSNCYLHHPHDLAIDNTGQIWFSEDGADPTVPIGDQATIGYVKSDFNGVVLFPSFSVYPDSGYACGNTGHTGFAGGGIVQDPVSTDLFFSDFCRRRLGRVKKL